MAENTNEPSEQAETASLGLSEIERLTAILESDLEQPEEQNKEPDQEESNDSDIVEPEQLENVTEDAVEGEEVEDPTETETEEPVEEELKFDINGESVGVEELRLGYLRQSDYTQKTQNLAESRRAAEAQIEETTATMSALLSAAGADLSRFQGVDWERVAIENPDQYKQAKASFEQTRSTYDFIKAQSDQYQVEQQQQAETAQKEAAQESLTVLKTRIPNWNNDLYYRIADYAQKDLGVTSEEFNQVADHRIITALWKAMQFDQAKTVAAKKKIKASPTKTLSGGKADATKAEDSESYRKASDRLRKTGRVEDAAAVILNRIK